MSRHLHPASKMYEISQRLNTLAQQFGVIAVQLGPEVGAHACDTLLLLSKLAGDLPTVARVDGADARGEMRRFLDQGVRSFVSPVVDSGYALGDFVQALRVTAGDAFAQVRKIIRIETVAGCQRFAEIVRQAEFADIAEVGVDWRGLAGADRNGAADPAAYALAREVGATAKRLGKRVAVGGGISPANAPMVAGCVRPDYVYTGLLVLDVAKVQDVADAVRQAIGFERFFVESVPEAWPEGRPALPPPVEGPDQATEGVSAGLQARKVFKFITGIDNPDRAEIRFLAQVYALAGADIIDVAARPDLVEVTREAIATARRQALGLGRTTQIMVSLALERDPHVERPADHPDHRAFVVPLDTAAMAANVEACLQAGAAMVELHASDSEDPALREAVEALSAVLEGRYLSVCLGAEAWRPPRDVLRQATLVREVHGPHTMIQAEGLSLVKDGSLGSSIQGLALAQALLLHTRAYVVVAGGANYWTRDLSDVLGVPIHGIASGSYARRLVAGFLDAVAAARLARRFAERARGGVRPYV